jgi:hypothetical protein
MTASSSTNVKADSLPVSPKHLTCLAFIRITIRALKVGGLTLEQFNGSYVTRSLTFDPKSSFTSLFRHDVMLSPHLWGLSDELISDNVEAIQKCVRRASQ